MFLLRLQLLNRVKREKKTPTLHCSSACAAAGKEADGRAVVSDAESIGRRVPAEQGHLTSTCSATQEDSLQPPWHLGPWSCAASHPHAIRPASHLFLQTAPLPNKEDSAHDETSCAWAAISQVTEVPQCLLLSLGSSRFSEAT